MASKGKGSRTARVLIASGGQLTRKQRADAIHALMERQEACRKERRPDGEPGKEMADALDGIIQEWGL